MADWESIQEVCPTCGSTEPYSGTCGTSDSDTKALCKRKATPAALPAQAIGYLHMDGNFHAVMPAHQEASKGQDKPVEEPVANEAAFYVSNIDLRRIAGGGLKRGEVMVSVAPFDFFTAVYLRPTQQVLSSSTPQLSDEEIDAHWDSLPSIKIHNEATSRGLRTEVLLRRCFARSILAAAGGREK